VSVDDLLSGNGLRVLRASRDFWDDRSVEVVEAAWAEINTAFQALARDLTARWGVPAVVDLEPYLWSENPVPAPVDQLCQCSGEIHVWLVGGRWVGLAVGQQDGEFPVELLAVVGERPFPLA